MDPASASRPFYGASPVKRRRRRTKADMQAIRTAMYDALEEDHPMTVRQVYYRLVSMGDIDKTEAQYQTVCRLLVEMRRAGDLPFDWLADATRWQRKPTTHSSLKAMLQRSTRMYRQAIWDDQDVYVEVWLEKDALAGVIVDVTAEWDVPLMVTRGYPSLSYLYSAAEALKKQDKPCYMYYFGDHDPSGVDIPRKVEADLRQFAPGAEIHFARVAVLPWQIEKWELQTRPTKKSDARSKHFRGESVEVDAIQPNQIRQLVRDCIEQHINQDALERTLAIEEAERETLQTIIENMEDAA